MKRIIPRTVFFLLLFFSLAAAETFSKTEVKTFQISPSGKIVVDNVNGSIKVKSWDKDQVSLEITKTVRADGQEEADKYFDRLRVEIENGDDYLNVRTHYPHDMGGGCGFFDWLFHGGSRYVNVEYVLIVPSTAKLDLESTNGKIEVQAVTGDVKARSTNGRLRLDGVSGKIDASTTNGSITASVVDADKFKEMRLRTTNGSIKIYCPKDINADVYAHTTNGSIETEFPITVSGTFNRKSLSGKINNGGKEIYLHTTNGSIEINKE